nr:hypothetical protein Hi04_10k_c3120_00036 [uncultured bacterium]
MDPLTPRLLPLAAAGWLAAALCAGVAASHLRRLSRHAAPPLEEVRGRLARAANDAERALARSELLQDAAEAQRALSLAVLLPRSLSRISLASGTALALTTLARGVSHAGPPLPLGALLAFTGGFAGMIACAAFGRQANALASEMRQHWKRVTRAVEQWTPAKTSG